MAFPKRTQLTAWSNSRFSSYNQCPLKVKLSALDKIQEPKSPAMERGNTIHKLAEDYLKGTLKRLPPELKLQAPEFKRLRAKIRKDPASCIVEDNWAFTKDWGPSQWNDWNNCWLRVKLDLAERNGNRVLVTDWKTGKYRPDNREDYIVQLELYALGALLVFGKTVPDLEVQTRLVYLDVPVIYPEPPEMKIYTLADLEPLKKEWNKRVKPMMADKTFAPKPNKWCYSCHYRADNKAAGGGQCKF